MKRYILVLSNYMLEIGSPLNHSLSYPNYTLCALTIQLLPIQAHMNHTLGALTALLVTLKYWFRGLK